MISLERRSLVRYEDLGIRDTGKLSCCGGDFGINEKTLGEGTKHGKAVGGGVSCGANIASAVV